MKRVHVFVKIIHYKANKAPIHRDERAHLGALMEPKHTIMD